MDAHALLISQGWRGTGHSLHPTSDSRGLCKPILSKHKKDGAGLGAKTSTVDQWWLSAIDEQLKGLDTTTGSVVQTLQTGKLNRLSKDRSRFQLDAYFVKGETLGGTLGKKISDTRTKCDTQKKTPIENASDRYVSDLLDAAQKGTGGLGLAETAVETTQTTLNRDLHERKQLREAFKKKKERHADRHTKKHEHELDLDSKEARKLAKRALKKQKALCAHEEERKRLKRLRRKEQKAAESLATSNPLSDLSTSAAADERPAKEKKEKKDKKEKDKKGKEKQKKEKKDKKEKEKKEKEKEEKKGKKQKDIKRSSPGTVEFAR